VLNEVAGQPYHTFTLTNNTMRISQILERSVNLYPDKSRFFLVAGDRFLNYKDSWKLSECYKLWIRDLILQNCENSCSTELEIVVAFLSHNSSECFLAMMGSVASHYIPYRKFMSKDKHLEQDPQIMTAMLNVRWTPVEIARALAVEENSNDNDSIERSREYITIVLYGQGMEEKARDACILMNGNQKRVGHRSVHARIPEIDCVTSIPKRHLEEIKFELDSCSFTDTAQHDALLLFTSGTTSGKPKGVRLSHLSLIIQSMAKLMHPCSYDSSTRMLATTVPMFHVGGISSALSVAMAGGMLIFPKSYKALMGFSPHVVLDSIRSQNNDLLRVDTNTLVLVPAMLHAILREIEKNGKPQVYDNVRLILVGGQSITSPQLQRSKIYFPNARIVQTFACTEAGSSITFSTVVDPKATRDGNAPSFDELQLQGCNVGSPPHHIDLQIFRLDANNKPTNTIVSPYTIGAIGTKGPHVMNGYWKPGQDLLSDGIDRNNWLVLNDIGYLDDKGRLFFCGRSNDVIRTGGETVFSPEVEKILVQHPSVDQCAVFALPDEKFGECVSAAIVFGGRSSTFNSQKYPTGICLANQKELRDLREYCADRQLSAYKHPRVIFFCDELPCNSSGKVLKHVLASKCLAVRDKVHSKL